LRDASAHTQETISKYEFKLREQKRELEEKVHEALKAHHEVEEVIVEPSDEAGGEERKVVKYKRKPEATEYKFAFGQKIPVNYVWKVK
jgi:hypothetical protein